MSLAGCEGLNAWNERGPTEQNPPLSSESTTLGQAGGSGIKFPPPSDRDLKTLTTKLSGGSVEIYDVDGSSATSVTGAPLAPVTPDYPGIPVATDPRVTVFPLDGGAAYPTTQLAQAPAPSWPNSMLPLGKVESGPLTPEPATWEGGGSSRKDDGRIPSPEVGKDISRVYFAYGSANLNGQSRQALQSVAETAKFAPVDRVSVEGHASQNAQTSDRVKAKILNLKESMNRAQAVSNNLIENGVPAEKIKTVAWGDTRPEGRSEPAQRRVDVVTGGQ
jgi:outer membrane protein OmpA-like peptidoglycan-associated protein